MMYPKDDVSIEIARRDMSYTGCAIGNNGGINCYVTLQYAGEGPLLLSSRNAKMLRQQFSKGFGSVLEDGLFTHVRVVSVVLAGWTSASNSTEEKKASYPSRNCATGHS